jgi:hypothetical protein
MGGAGLGGSAGAELLKVQSCETNSGTTCITPSLNERNPQEGLKGAGPCAVPSLGSIACFQGDLHPSFLWDLWPDMLEQKFMRSGLAMARMPYIEPLG